LLAIATRCIRRRRARMKNEFFRDVDVEMKRGIMLANGRGDARVETDLSPRDEPHAAQTAGRAPALARVSLDRLSLDCLRRLSVNRSRDRLRAADTRRARNPVIISRIHEPVIPRERVKRSARKLARIGQERRSSHFPSSAVLRRL